MKLVNKYKSPRQWRPCPLALLEPTALGAGIPMASRLQLSSFTGVSLLLTPILVEP
jgi:hypothetical protein